MPTADPADLGIQYEVDGHIGHIRLNRPQRRNAIDIPMRHQLLTAIRMAAEQAEVRVVILSGSGTHFCAGGDTSTMGQEPLSAEQGHARMQPVLACAKALLELPKPVIAAVDGVAYGGGFGLSLCADILLATPRARFCLPFMRIGLVPDFAALFTLPRLIGLQRTRQLIFSAGEIDGATALQDGIATELVAPENLHARAIELATAMYDMPATAFAMTKQALLRTFSSDHASMMDFEAMAQAIAFNTDTHRQAISRLHAKQPPSYSYPSAMDNDND